MKFTAYCLTADWSGEKNSTLECKTQNVQNRMSNNVLSCIQSVLHKSQNCGTSSRPGCSSHSSQTHAASSSVIDRLHPYLSMSPWISLLPLWDISPEEATSEARLAFRAYRWRPPSVRYLSEENQLEEVDVQSECDIKNLSYAAFSYF